MAQYFIVGTKKRAFGQEKAEQTVTEVEKNDLLILLLLAHVGYRQLKQAANLTSNPEPLSLLHHHKRRYKYKDQYYFRPTEHASFVETTMTIIEDWMQGNSVDAFMKVKASELEENTEAWTIRGE